MLYLTYGLDVDGLGGQYQRIIGIMAISKKYGCEYVHTPIEFMEHIPEPKQEYLNKIEEYFQINQHYKNSKDIKYDKVMSVRSNQIEEAILFYKSTTTNILLLLGNPSEILDKDTSIYNYIMPELRQIKQELVLPHYNENKKNIAIHIRRGDVNQINHPNRYMPTEYFKTVAEKIMNQYTNANICIFTEITAENKHEFDIFNNMNVKIIANEDVLTTLDYIIRADILVMCKSSFSYIAGLYNKNIVLYTDFWHNPMAHWEIISVK